LRVRFESVSKRFGNVAALTNLTLDVADREFLVLLGPSGCGKTTALRIVAGLEEATSGEIYIGERLVNDLPARDRNIAMVFQNYALYPHMSVYNNIAFGLRMRKYPRDEQDRRVRDAAAALGLADLLKRRPGELSGGQRQRVALGRAIVREPDVFLMDEPLSNLDAKLRVQMREELIKLHRRLGTTFVYVTHDQVEAMTMGQRVVILEGGELQQVGPPQEVYDRPANLFVAEFIGSPPMNFLDAEPAEVEGRRGLRAAGAFFALSSERWAALTAQATSSLIVGIRPEHLALYEGADESFAAVLEGEVDLVESLGSEQHVSLSVEEQTLKLKLASGVPVQTGARLRVGVAEAHLHLFDGQSGRRVD
jgi:multiple sugar transport system ATP-binding protein